MCLFRNLQQARAEQEEEYISNTLLKKINTLKKEKEMLAVNYEHEEEFLTNDLTRKLNQVRTLPIVDSSLMVISGSLQLAMIWLYCESTIRP